MFKFIFKSILRFVSSTDVRILAMIPILIGVLCFYGVTRIAPKYEGYTSQNFLLFMGLIICAFSPLAVVIKKEFFVGPIHFKGLFAVILGILFSIIFIGLAIIPIIIELKDKWP